MTLDDMADRFDLTFAEHGIGKPGTGSEEINGPTLVEH